MPDLTIRQGKSTCNGAGLATLSIEVCNRGTEPVGAGVEVTAYANGSPACTAETEQILRPGMCTNVMCDWTSAGGPATDVEVVVDDDGTGAGDHTECREANNTFTIEGVTCP
jgi:hypothetical protein